jgi:hypothetical protein
LQARNTALLNQVKNLQTSNATLESQVGTLQSQLASSQNLFQNVRLLSSRLEIEYCCSVFLGLRGSRKQMKRGGLKAGLDP